MSAGASVSLNRIGQIAITVQDVERATAFYRNQLAMTFLFSAGPLSFFDCGGIRLMLSRPEAAEFDHSSSVLYFTVAEIHAAHQELERRGVRFEGAPHVVAKLPHADLWMAFFRDSENNLLALMSEVAR